MPSNKMFDQIRMNKFRESRSARTKDVWAKKLWLEKNDYKTYYWSQWLKLHEMRTIGRKMYNPDTEEIADWMIRERTREVCEKRICFNLRSFCWASGKRMFLKSVTVVHTQIDGPGDPVKEKFYFSPKHYTLWVMKQ